MELYFQLMFEKLINFIIVLGALNWGMIGAFRFNMVTFLVGRITTMRLNRVIYVIIGLCAILKLFNRDYYLPFLGKQVFPCDSMELKVPKEADTITNVKVKKNSNVIYWASEGTSLEDVIIMNPSKAYDSYSNAGVALSDKDGVAQLKFRYPSRYRVRTGVTLKPHVHYRVCLGNGMLGPVKTIFLK